MQMQNFDATGIPPQQVSGKHPEGNFPFQISNTRVVPTKANDGGIFEVEFTTPGGSIINRYNLFNKSQQAVEIAQKELSALCHATGVFKLSMNADNLAMCGHELRGARGVIKVRTQPGNEQYSEVEKVFDANGNEPGKSGATAAPQPQQGGNSGWGTPAQQQPNNAPAPSPAPQGWQAGPSNPAPANQGGGAAPPWAR